MATCGECKFFEPDQQVGMCSKIKGLGVTRSTWQCEADFKPGPPPLVDVAIEACKVALQRLETTNDMKEALAFYDFDDMLNRFRQVLARQDREQADDQQ